MPKIAAATVAEHRARQRAVLLGAAERMLVEGGYEGLSFPSLAKAAGLARPSVYGYFATKDDIVVAVCEQVLPRFLRRVDAAMARARGPRERLVAFVRAELEAAGAGEHRIAVALRHAPLSAAALARIDEIHQTFAPDLAAVIAELGHRQPDLLAHLVHGVVSAGVARIDAGEPHRRVVDAAVALVSHGLG